MNRGDYLSITRLIDQLPNNATCQELFARYKKLLNNMHYHYGTKTIPSEGIPVIIPTPLTRPSRKSILIPGRMYS